MGKAGGTADRSDRSEERELRRLVRQSRVLSPVLKRQWLTVLPHLSEADRLELRAILSSEPATGTARQPATPEGG